MTKIHKGCIMSNIQEPAALVEGQEPTAKDTDPGQTQSITKEMLDKLLADQETKFKGLITATEENYKKQLQGVNQKNTEYKKQLDAKLTEDEKIQAEKEDALNEAIKAKEEAESWKKNLLVSKGLSDAGLPQDFDEFISGVDEATISASVTKLKEYIDNQVKVNSEKSVNEALGGKPPKGGDGKPALDAIAKLEKEHAEAIKNKDGQKAFLIKEQLIRLKEK